MREIWVISDTHFGHHNIIKYAGRPFQTAWEMDEAIFNNWNSVVKDGDLVYHLGDVYMGSPAEASVILSKLKGRKRLVLGNHDDLKDKVLLKHFQKITLWRDFRDFGILLTHIPVHPNSILPGRVNVHGHIHEKDSPGPQYRNVCVEKTNYAPINIEELRIREIN